MSHIVTIETEVRCAESLRAACGRLGLALPVHGEHKLFSGQKATGLGVMLPDWRFPVVCDTKTGKVHYDNYGGSWGKQEHLDALKQAYAVEKAKLEARKQGHSVTERVQADGTVKLTIQVQGGAA